MTRKHKPDYTIVLIVGVLLVLGLIVLYSISPALSNGLFGSGSEYRFLYQQLFNILIGSIIFGIASVLPMSFWKKILPIMLIVTVVSMLFLFVPGVKISSFGATRWIGLAGFSFQPSELLKLTTLLYFAQLVSQKSAAERTDYKELIIPSTVALGVIGLFVVVFQRDLGTMIVIAAIIVALLYIGNVRLRHLFVLVGGMSAAAAVSIILFPHRLARFLTFLSPETDTQGAGYHVNQALIAIGSGGIFGLGLGRSVQVYGYLPVAASDSIFAIWGEKFGFIGSVVMLGLYGFLLYKIYRIAADVADEFSKLVAVGVFVWIASHIVVNLGAMISLLPLTGITLPFFSAGGSSLLFMMLAIGIVFQISRHTARSTSTQLSSVTARRKRVVRG